MRTMSRIRIGVQVGATILFVMAILRSNKFRNQSYGFVDVWRYY